MAPDQVSLELVGYMGQAAQGLALANGYAYVTLSRELAILDISDPAHLRRVGYVVLPGTADDVAVAGGYAYVLSLGNLYVVDVSDPAAPHIAGSCGNGYGLFALDVSGSYVYTIGWEGLWAVDVSNPNDPHVVGSGSTVGVDISISGSHAYVAGGYDGTGLRVVDLANPAAPVEVGSLEASAVGVYASGSYAYVADLKEGIHSRLRIIDASDPAHPQEVGYAGLFGVYGPWGNLGGVYVSGHNAYVAGAFMNFSGKLYGGLDVVDVADPAHPVDRGGYITTELPYPHAVAAAGQYAFVTENSGGLRAVDVSDPQTPVEVGAYRGVSGAVVVPPPGAGPTYAYLADGGLHVADVSTPTNPSPSGHLYTDAIGPLKGIDVAGSYAYVPGIVGLWIVDVSDPLHPVQAGSYDYDQAAEDVAVAGDYAYLAGGSEDLVALDVADPAHPVHVSGYDIPGGGLAVYISGTHAYLAGTLGLWVLNVSNPSDPQEDGYCEIPYAVGVQVAGHYAYVPTRNYMTYEDGLTVVDIADPAAPAVVGSCIFPTPPRAGRPAGAQLTAHSFVAADDVGVVDVSDPTDPHVVGAYETPWYAPFEDVYAVGDTVYATADGLYILRVTTPALQVEPPALSFLAAAGGADPAARTLRVDASSGSITWTVTISPTAGWLEVAPVSGTTPASLTVTAHISGLSVGSYDTRLIVGSSAGVRQSPQAVPVTLRVAEEVYSVHLPLVLR